MIEINNSMTDDEIISKIVGFLEDNQKIESMRKIGLEWSSEYTQEKYAERFLSVVKRFIGENIC